MMTIDDDDDDHIAFPPNFVRLTKSINVRVILKICFFPARFLGLFLDINFHHFNSTVQ